MLARTLRLGWLACLAAASLGSTCIVVEEQPRDTTYGDESAEQATMDDMMDAAETDAER